MADNVDHPRFTDEIEASGILEYLDVAAVGIEVGVVEVVFGTYIDRALPSTG